MEEVSKEHSSGERVESTVSPEQGLVWHEVPKAEQEKVLASGITVGDFMKRYAQPPWCGYPEALAASMGCWSLMIPDKIRTFERCANCDCRIETKAHAVTEREAESAQAGT